MVEKRKVNSEFEKKLKEIEDCLDKFNRAKEGILSTDNNSSKLKFEEEIKKESKKLQKLKENLRSLSFTSEAKFKNSIEETRKKIDKALDYYKVFEKEKESKTSDGNTKESTSLPISKTKAATDEESTKIKEELTTQITALKDQWQSYKSELESLSTNKGKSKQPSRTTQLNKWIENHVFHINKLQLVQKKIESDEIKLTAISALNSNIKNYLASHEEIESGTLEEFYTNFLNDESPVENAPDTSQQKNVDDLSTNTHQESLEETFATLSIKTEETDSKSTQPNATTDSHFSNKDTKANYTGANAQPSETTPGKTFPTQFASTTPPPPSTTTNNILKNSLLGQPTTMNSSNYSTSKSTDEGAHHSSQTGFKSTDTSQQSLNNSNLNTDLKSKSEKEPQTPNVKKSTFDEPPKVTARNILHDYNWYNDQLYISYQNCPTRFDGDRIIHHIPKYPWKPTHSAFPTTRIENSDMPQNYQLFNVDTLFLIFYYKMGTYQQYLAAKELKRRNWRFHKKSLIWFQRHEEPRMANETLEQGDYVYFDFKTEWNFKIETDFLFEYAYLEDEVLD